MKDFNEWKTKNENKYAKKMKAKLTPHEFHLTQLKHGMERAFTGEYWWTNDVGRYDCISCTQRLFMYDHKFINKSGYPTFWNSLENAVKFNDDNLEVNKVTNAHECPTLKGKMPVKRCVCSNVSVLTRFSLFFLQLLLTCILCLLLQCEAHLGYVFDDGPNPLGLRYQINSVALSYEKKPWFDFPESKFKAKQIRMFQLKQNEKLALYNELKKDEAMMNMGSYRDRVASLKAEEKV